ncbi:MAG TPA: redoxin domain-containing protein [Rhodocyclaceae bacterium]|nr:redoxin domain-containing protein [Rhodocyclaceae bacterium]
MHKLKAAYISLYMASLMTAMAVAVWQLTTAPDAAAWWGVLLAVTVPVAFFMRLMLASVARTGASLWWIPAAGGAGTVWALAFDGLGLPALVAGIVGVALGLLYTHWYSRFGARDTTKLATGQHLPDFPLLDLEGRPVSSLDLIDTPALWLFYRGNWCPLCMAQIREVAEQYRTLASRGVAVHLVSPQSQEHTKALAQRFEVPMRFLTDRDNRAADRLGILAKGGLPMGVQMLGYDADVPMPTVLITAAGGRIIYSDLTENYRIRPEPADFLAALDRAGLPAGA